MEYITQRLVPSIDTFVSVLRNAVKFAQLKSPKSFSQKIFLCVCLNVGLLALCEKRNATLNSIIFQSVHLFIIEFIENNHTSKARCVFRQKIIITMTQRYFKIATFTTRSAL